MLLFSKKKWSVDSSKWGQNPQLSGGSQLLSWDNWLGHSAPIQSLDHAVDGSEIRRENRLRLEGYPILYGGF